jgi:hypothetical protein
MLFICCNTFSGLAVIKVFVQMSHFLEIKKLISKIKKITKGRKKKKKWWKPSTFLLQASPPLRSGTQ